MERRGGAHSRGDTNAERGCFLEAHILGDLDLDIALGGDVLSKSAVLVLQRVGAVDEAGHAVALLEVLGDLAPDLLDDAGIV